MRILLNHLIFVKVTLAWTISINVRLAGIGGFPSGSDSKESSCNEEGQSSISGSGWSPGEGNDNLLQYSCLENPWMEGPGGLQFIRSQRVKHDRATSPSFFFFFFRGWERLIYKKKKNGKKYVSQYRISHAPVINLYWNLRGLKH